MTPIVPETEVDGEWLEKEADWLEDLEEGEGYEVVEEDEEEPPITDHLQIFQDVSHLDCFPIYDKDGSRADGRRIPGLAVVELPGIPRLQGKFLLQHVS